MATKKKPAVVEEDKLANARAQAKAQYESIYEMVAALELDWDRMNELREERQSLALDADNAIGVKTHLKAKSALEDWDDDNGEELKNMLEAKGDIKDRDEAERRIQEDALEVQVRGDWHTPGDEEGNEPVEFYILLCTGGPACRIMGELGQHNEPTRAWMQFQDWFTPWVDYFGDDTFTVDQDVLLTYCRQYLSS